MMKLIKYPKKKNREKILSRPFLDNSLLEKKVSAILKDVKKNGDDAVRRYTLKFDKVKSKDFQISQNELTEAGKNIPVELKEAIQIAKNNIEKFHLAQKEEKRIIETMPGVKCWRKSAAIEKVGLYIPGGSAPLFSTVLMLGIPAKIAGCREIILCTPGRNLIVLYIAHLLGINKVHDVGGAQAIAAMAYGTKTISKMDKIFGPGNRFVTCAKQLVQKDGVAIDMPAGPSELAIFADETCIPEFVAADLLSQAEHGDDSQVILISDSKKVIDQVQQELSIQINFLPRKGTAKKSLKNSTAILVKDKNEVVELLNDYAPEHLILACMEASFFEEKIVNAGSVFIGNYSPESAGDYASGTNHTLPTNGYAKSYSGISLDSFVKKTTYQEISEEGLRNIGKTIEVMAEAEGLQAHANAVKLRKK